MKEKKIKIDTEATHHIIYKEKLSDTSESINDSYTQLLLNYSELEKKYNNLILDKKELQSQRSEKNFSPYNESAKNIANDNTKSKPFNTSLSEPKKIAETSEKYLESIIKNMGDPIFVKDKDSRLIMVNEAFCEFFKLSKTEVIGKTLAEKVSINKRKSFFKVDRQVIKNGIENITIEQLTVSGEEAKSISTRKNRFIDGYGNKFIIGIIRDISEIKQSEARIQKQHDFLKHTQIIAKIGIYSFDIVSNKWTSSEILDGIFGIDENFDKSMQSWLSIINEDSQKDVEEYLEKMVIGRKSAFDKIYKINKIDSNELRWVHGIGELIFDKNNNPIRLIGSIQDITELKKSEQKIQESEEKYRSLVENSPDGIIITFGEEHKILYVNGEAVRMINGDEKDEILGKSFLQFIHPQSMENVIFKLTNLVLDVDQSSTIEEKLIGIKGLFVDVEIRAIPTIYENNEAVQIMIHDITERKKAEVKIRQLSQAVEQSPVSIIISDLKGAIEYVNPKCIETSGYSLEEIIGQNARIFNCGEKNLLEYDGLWQTIRSGKEWHGEFKNKKKDGNIFWEWASISPILNDQGIVTHYIALKEDITNRKQIDAELLEAKNKAEESDRLKLAFLANMSHEIRTPMNGILGFTTLLKEPKLTGKQQQEYIKIIEKSGERMLNIINDIINISKIESGEVEVVITETNINEKLEYLHEFFKNEAAKKGVELTIVKILSKIENIVSTDKEKLYAILTNLLKNAIKFTNLSGTIKFGCERKGDFLEFFVEDSGFGISESQQAIIFERFRQANDSQNLNKEGSGLGLAISKAYIEMLGGTLWVKSRENFGSTFYFTLPFNPSAKFPSKSERIAIHNEVITTENAIKDLKILIAEDDNISKLLISIIVKPISREIIKVSTGTEAVEICKSNPDIDLILMDINMPEMGGYEATKCIRQFNKDIVIIAQTANGMEKDREDAILAGCTDYISKPINFNTLSGLINIHLSTKHKLF